MLKMYNYMSSGVLLTGTSCIDNSFKYAIVTDGSGNIVDPDTIRGKCNNLFNVGCGFSAIRNCVLYEFWN